MSNTALSLLAIGIFVVTMSALVGPIVGLLPVVPTMATVLIVGFYGIDATIWSGKGSAFLLSWVQNRLPQFKERVLCHEAGHFLAAHLLGFEILSYSLGSAAGKPDRAREGGVEIDASQDMLDVLDRYCTIWMAGIAAEKHVYQDAEGGADDLYRFQKATAHLQNPELHRRWAALRARNLIADNQQAFEALIAHMRANASVEVCCAAIDRNLSRSRL